MNCECCDISINNEFEKYPQWEEQFCERCVDAIYKMAINNFNSMWIEDCDGKSSSGGLEFVGMLISSPGFKQLEFMEFKKSDILLIKEVDKFME